jgi:hypothetical protein
MEMENKERKVKKKSIVKLTHSLTQPPAYALCEDANFDNLTVARAVDVFDVFQRLVRGLQHVTDGQQGTAELKFLIRLHREHVLDVLHKQLRLRMRMEQIHARVLEHQRK